MRFHKAFSMLELVFVIVIIGILAKFGVAFLSDAYTSFLYSNINNKLQSQSEAAVEFIASRLQYRIKGSEITRNAAGTFQPLASSTQGSNAVVLEWVGSDIEGFRADAAQPNWSGIIDLDAGTPGTADPLLFSPQTNTAAENTLISTLSNGNSGIANAALYFIGSDSNINTGYGWGGAILNQQTATMHPITTVGTFNASQFRSGIAASTFTGVTIREYYQLAWTAYALVLNGSTLRFYYDYQPWLGDGFANGSSQILMENVSTFRFSAIGSLVKIQVCVKSDLLTDDYSICKEKVVF